MNATPYRNKCCSHESELKEALEKIKSIEHGPSRYKRAVFALLLWIVALCCAYAATKAPGTGKPNGITGIETFLTITWLATLVMSFVVLMPFSFWKKVL